MLENNKLDRALEACFEAVIEFSRWPDALQKVAESFEATSCVIRCCDPLHPFRDDQRGRLKPTPDSTAHAEFTALWLERIDGAPDPHAQRMKRLAKPPVCFTVEDEITTAEERSLLPYYSEIARPGDREWWAALSFTVGGRKWCLPMFRNAQRGRFYPEESQQFLAIAPVMSRIISLAEKTSTNSAISYLGFLEQMQCAAVLLDLRGSVVRTNEYADNLFGPDLFIRHGKLHVADPKSNAWLQAVLRYLRMGQLGSAGPSNPIVVCRNQSPWLLAEAIPVVSIAHDLFDGGDMLLCLTELSSSQTANELLLRKTFHLTLAEGRFASRLLAGMDIDTASSSLGISRETARTHLRAVMAKTSTHRQTELLMLLSRIRSLSRQ